MGRIDKKIKYDIVTITEMAAYFGIHRHTMKKRLLGVNLKNITEIFDFVRSFDKK